MLSGDKCCQIKRAYKMQHNGLTLKGQIHGALYYHYFKQNVHQLSTVHSIAKLRFIRGFSVYGNKDGQHGKFEFKSGAFNQIDLPFKDKQYRHLSSAEENFISFCLNQYWNQFNKVLNRSRQTIFYFDEFLKSQLHQQRSSMIIQENNVNDYHEIKQDDGMINSTCPMIASYNQETFLEMESKQFGLNFYESIVLPQQCIFNILSFLSYKDETILRQCCELANQLIKYYYYKKYVTKHKIIDIITLIPVVTSQMDHNYYHNQLQCKFHFDLFHSRVATSQIDKFGINFGNLSFKNLKNCFILLPCFNCKRSDAHMNDLPKCLTLQRLIEKSLTRYCRLTTMIQKHQQKQKQPLKQIKNTEFTAITLVLKRLTYEEEEQKGKSENVKTDMEQKENRTQSQWYFKASNKKDDWHQFDIKSQNIIEKCYVTNCELARVTIDHDDVNGKNSMYEIYFNTNTNDKINHQLCEKYKSKGTFSKNKHRLLDYDIWRQSFTKYFYQKNLTTENYRIVKRVSKQAQDRYYYTVTNQMVHDYFCAIIPACLSVKI